MNLYNADSDKNINNLLESEELMENSNDHVVFDDNASKKTGYRYKKLIMRFLLHVHLNSPMIYLRKQR